MEKDALAVMVRVPIIGTVKTRLTPGLSASEACLLYEAFLKDLFSRLSSLTSIDIFIYYTVTDGCETVTDGCETASDGCKTASDGCKTASDGCETASDGCETASGGSDTDVDKVRLLSNIVPETFTLTPQKDGDLGDRMQWVFQELFDTGYARAALIGSDSPDIPLAYLRRAFTLLTDPCGDEPRPLVLGPALDGGYYLIAMKASLAACSASLFNGIAWGASSVLQETLDRAQEAGMQALMLAQWHDIDTCEDLAYIEGSACLPATARVLQGFSRRRL